MTGLSWFVVDGDQVLVVVSPLMFILELVVLGTPPFEVLMRPPKNALSSTVIDSCWSHGKLGREDYETRT